jgi:serine/threonine protein kinase
MTLLHPVLHDLHLVHTDLKPENILLVHNDYRITTVPGAVTGSRVCTVAIDLVPC